MSKLSGQHAVVTGGSRGIGAAIVQRLLAERVKVSVIARTELVESEGRQSFVADVTDEEALTTALKQAVEHFGAIDILVNNAGAAESALLDRTATELWQQMQAVNLNSVFYGCRFVLPAMRERGKGRIINIASTAGLKGYAYVSAYCAAKHGVIGLTRSIALETATSGVTVNAICPGFTDTNLVRESLDRIVSKTGRSKAEAEAELVKANPQQRLIQPEEVADTVIWLCSEQARSITGQSIVIAGGELM